jgi:UPF0755 protein
MRRRGCSFVAALLLVGAAALGWFGASWWFFSNLDEERAFVVPSGSSLTAVAEKLEGEGVIDSADAFLLRAKILGSSDPIKAGEFLLPAGASAATILDTFQHGEVIRRFVTVPEGLPSIMVWERLMAEPLLTGEVAVPAEGSVLPESYDFERGETRAAVLARMQQAMTRAIDEFWPKRGPNAVVKTKQEAVTLASIVEKETAKPSERTMVAGVLSNRLRIGMMLGADATTIYPITKGKPLGRLIRRSELRDRNPYNTRAVAGLPPGPITNPGRDSLAAVLNPARTDALYYVADGTGGHVFSRTLAEHNANAAKWRALRRARGEM